MYTGELCARTSAKLGMVRENLSWQGFGMFCGNPGTVVPSQLILRSP
jgi:hypothetical protein